MCIVQCQTKNQFKYFRVIDMERNYVPHLCLSKIFLLTIQSQSYIVLQQKRQREQSCQQKCCCCQPLSLLSLEVLQSSRENNIFLLLSAFSDAHPSLADTACAPWSSGGSSFVAAAVVVVFQQNRDLPNKSVYTLTRGFEPQPSFVMPFDGSTPISLMKNFRPYSSNHLVACQQKRRTRYDLQFLSSSYNLPPSPPLPLLSFTFGLVFLLTIV